MNFIFNVISKRVHYIFFCTCLKKIVHILIQEAAIAQLGERQTEDLEVPGSIPGLGSFFGRASYKSCNNAVKKLVGN